MAALDLRVMSKVVTRRFTWCRLRCDAFAGYVGTETGRNTEGWQSG